MKLQQNPSFRGNMLAKQSTCTSGNVAQVFGNQGQKSSCNWMSQIHLKRCAIKKQHLCDISKSECHKIKSVRQAVRLPKVPT